MMKLLHIKVSPDLSGSTSRVASECLVEKLRAHHAGLQESVLDLAKRPLPHLDAFTIAGFFPHQTYAVKLSSPLFRLRNNW